MTCLGCAGAGIAVGISMSACAVAHRLTIATPTVLQANALSASSFQRGLEGGRGAPKMRVWEPELGGEKCRYRDSDSPGPITAVPNASPEMLNILLCGMTIRIGAASSDELRISKRRFSCNNNTLQAARHRRWGEAAYLTLLISEAFELDSIGHRVDHGEPETLSANCP